MVFWVDAFDDCSVLNDEIVNPVRTAAATGADGIRTLDLDIQKIT